VVQNSNENSSIDSSPLTLVCINTVKNMNAATTIVVTAFRSERDLHQRNHRGKGLANNVIRCQ